MVQGVWPGSRFFLGSGMYSSVEGEDYNQQTGLKQGNTPFGNLSTDFQAAGNNQQTSEGGNQRPIPYQLDFGEQSLQQFSRQQEARYRKGGNYLAVSEEQLTFTAGDESLTVDPEANTRFYRSGNNEITLQNRDSGEELTIQVEDTLEISGEGQAEFGVPSPFQIQGGDKISIESGQYGPVINHPESNQNVKVQELEAPPEAGPLKMEVFRDPENERLQQLNYQLLQKPLAKSRAKEEASKEEDTLTIEEIRAERDNQENLEVENEEETEETQPDEEEDLTPAPEENEVPEENLITNPGLNSNQQVAQDDNLQFDGLPARETTNEVNSMENLTLQNEQNNEQLQQAYFSNEEETSGDTVNLFA